MELKPAEYTVGVKRCARCGEDHPRLAFKPLTRPMEEWNGGPWTHWGMCPTVNEPILMRFMEMESVPQTTDDPERKETVVNINGHSVSLPANTASGFEIRQAAIAQGLPIQPDFTLYSLLGNGYIEFIPADKTIHLRDGMEFKAIDPGDKS